MIKCMLLFGTRPEALKMAPVVNVLRLDDRFKTLVTVTAQHREMLDQVLDLFGLVPDHDLDIMRPGQSPSSIVGSVLSGLAPVLETERPDVVLVHGDTMTAFAGALSAFFHQIPVAHVEAGLRSYDPYDPFPEEMNRRLAGVLTSIHLAPTAAARDNLLRESVDQKTIYLTGNTIIDALHTTMETRHQFADPHIARAVSSGRRLVVVTTHRRENLGPPMERIFKALIRLTEAVSDVEIVFPVHLNPAVRDPARAMLSGKERITLIEPPDYVEFIHLMNAATLILTDSGGLQEEAPALGKPVLVLRETTERPEGISAGVAELVGTDPEKIVAEAADLLTDRAAYNRMATAVNPYGDGRAAIRIRNALLHWRGLAPRPADFVPGIQRDGCCKRAGDTV